MLIYGRVEEQLTDDRTRLWSRIVPQQVIDKSILKDKDKKKHCT